MVAVPLHAATPAPPGGARPRAAAADWVRRAARGDRSRALARAPRARADRAAAGRRRRSTRRLRASLGWILVNREGPRIQPGPRCYRRSWIRDGALTGTALAEMGFADEARAFLRWYAPYQLRRRARAVRGRPPAASTSPSSTTATASSSGASSSSSRLTGDRAFLHELWPHALRAVDAIAALRGASARRTPAAATRASACCPSRSATRATRRSPVHSYWDDFFAVRALADAADARGRLGDAAAAARFARAPRRMRRDLHASIAAHDGDARHRLPARLGRARRLRPDLDGDRARPVRRARGSCPRRARAHVRALLGGVRGAPARRARRTTPTRRTRCATRPRCSASAGSDRALALLDVADRRPAPAGVAPVARGARGATRARRASSATCRTAGSRRASCARCGGCSPTSAREDGALVLAAGVPEAGCATPPASALRGLPDALRRARPRDRRGRTTAACASASAAPRPSARRRRARLAARAAAPRRRQVDGLPYPIDEANRAALRVAPRGAPPAPD